MGSKEKDGNYVRSIVEMINKGSSPTKEVSPPRTPPSYLSLARSNNGYNASLLYEHHRKPSPSEASVVNGNGVEYCADNTKATEQPKYVSLAHMTSSKTKSQNHSKYSDLGLQIRSPQKNCRSFLRNINSFEEKGKVSEKSVTMVGMKMQCMLHLDEEVSKADGETPRIFEEQNEESLEISKVPDNISPTAGQETECDMRPEKRFAESVFAIIEKRAKLIPTNVDPQSGSSILSACLSEKEIMLLLRDEAERALEANVFPDEVLGTLRVVVGKINLVLNKKLKTFAELCEQNIDPDTNKKPVTEGDLAAYLELVLMETEGLCEMLRDLAHAAQVNWHLGGTDQAGAVMSPQTESLGASKNSASEQNNRGNSPRDIRPMQKQKRIPKTREPRRGNRSPLRPGVDVSPISRLEHFQ